MNSRQRRGVILMLLSVLGALVVFGGVLSVVNDVESKVGPEVTAYQLRQDVEPYVELSEKQFTEISVPKRWLPDTAVTDLAEIDRRIAVNPLKKGSLLQRDMIADRPALEPGEQEIAIMIDASTGVAGKITPGSRVNVFATFPGEGDAEPVSKVLVDRARVIDVGRLTSLEPDDDGRAGRRQVVPITFALDTTDAQRVAYAESFATHVRLALVAPGDDNPIPKGERDYRLSRDK
ncbi:Flp pilus assembly protein CpaB [Streptomyces durbertensis]|uniref:Flp pilus assembly protein CpaB n=1 Tax=Streptomyces durbertensis TaxID=2448886 RepID=A0ABR6EN34_9ACTN|nr:Flp pilus assembly protein CpaB [Streptomyces durbertensis]MBB1246523.1 Flp pilus assembly protein CpaB [Streptomyces durbertensis]